MEVVLNPSGLSLYVPEGRSRDDPTEDSTRNLSTAIVPRRLGTVLVNRCRGSIINFKNTSSHSFTLYEKGKAEWKGSASVVNCRKIVYSNRDGPGRGARLHRRRCRGVEQSDFLTRQN